MKNLFKIGLALVLSVGSAKAASFSLQSFLNPGMTAVSFTTNSFPTNLLSTSTTTNVVGLLWTNHIPYLNNGTTYVSGELVGIGTYNTGGSAALTNAFGSFWYSSTNQYGPLIYATNTSANVLNPFVDVQIPPNSFGDMPNNTITNIAGMILIQATGLYSTNTGTLNFVFSVVPDGVLEATTSVLTLPVTMNGTTPVIYQYQLPYQLVAGAKKVRLRSVYQTAAGSKDNSGWIQAVEFCGYQP